MTYADYTRNTKEPLKRIAHARRFQQLVRDIAAPVISDTVLDYGCGDGHLLSYFAGQMNRQNLVGYDPNPRLLAEATEEIRDGAQLTTDIELLKSRRPFGFSLIYCNEVCEHLTDNAMKELFDNVKALSAPHGRVVFGVPIETGLSGLVKNLYRAAKGAGDPANVRNALLSLVAAPIERQTTDVEWFGHHVGFDHAKFRKKLCSNGFKINRTHCLPLMFTGAALNNEIYFICSAR